MAKKWEKCPDCVKAQRRGLRRCTKHANALAAKQKRWRKKNPARAAYGEEAEGMLRVAEMIAGQILLAEEWLDPLDPNYPALRRSLYPWWWSINTRYADPPYTRIETIPDYPPRPRVLKQLVREAYLKIKKKKAKP